MEKAKGFTISSGNWTSNNNFTGYTLTGEVRNVFIPEKLMNASGFETGKDIKFPIEVMAVEREVQPAERDSAGKPVLNKDGSFKLAVKEDGNLLLITRTQATAVFKSLTEKAKVFAQSDSRLFDAMVKKTVDEIASSEGLTLADVTALEDATV